MALVDLTTIKNYLNIPGGDTSYDAFLTGQEVIIASAVENYCGRKFNIDTYTQVFYKSEFQDKDLNYKELFLYHYPVTNITQISEIERADGIDVSTENLTAEEYRSYNKIGRLKRMNEGYEKSWFNELSQNSRIEVQYDAGYATLPLEIESAILELIAERYNKKVAGVNLDFGNDVQRVSIPGVMSIDFDYTLQANERSVRFGMILGNYVNIFDHYRTERVLFGEIKDNHV